MTGFSFLSAMVGDRPSRFGIRAYSVVASIALRSLWLRSLWLRSLYTSLALIEHELRVLMDKVLLFMVICLLSLVSVQNVLRYWSSVFMQKIRRSFLLKLLIVIIRWWKIFLRIAVRKPNFVLLPILRVKENISRLRQ